VRRTNIYKRIGREEIELRKYVEENVRKRKKKNQVDRTGETCTGGKSHISIDDT